ncbi:MAG: hypothetical protein IPL99_26410 [Candidatus Competibacteraceae bacterium]|nr:hypothetical protein [Candidatus Competibacteraceae bacterium]
MLLLNPDGDNPKERARLEVRWRVEPDTLAKGAVDYVVSVRTEQDILAETHISHSGKPIQKAVFTQDSFDELDEKALFEPQVVIRALGDNAGETESEDFILCFGQDNSETVTRGSSKVYPTLALSRGPYCPGGRIV